MTDQSAPVAGAAARLREDLLGPAPSARQSRLAWVGILLVTALGGLLRFWRLGEPRSLVFDETYYVKQGWSLRQHGVEMEWIKQPDGMPDSAWNSGDFNVFTDQAQYIVHPPVGKWVIALGQMAAGIETSFSWRLSVAVLGTAMILMIGRIAFRLYGSALLATFASALLAFDGHHLVHSRTGLLDLILAFFVLAGFGAVLLDRDQSRRLLARRVAGLTGGRLHGAMPAAMITGPWLGLRPWRWVAGIMLGLACGTKWSGLYVLAGLGLLTVLWDMAARRRVGVRDPWRGALFKDAPYAFVAMVGGALATYIASWAGWFASDKGWDRHWAEQNPDQAAGWLPRPLASLWHYHEGIYAFHKSLTSDHTYKANPWSWTVQSRPTSFFYEAPAQGTEGCTVEKCSQAITSLGNPAVWWGGTIALVVLIGVWLLRRDWRAGAVLNAMAFSYLPWFLMQSRTVYAFYAVAFLPFMVLALTHIAGLVMGSAGDSRARRRWGAALVLAYLALVIGLFTFFYPVNVGMTIPYDSWRQRMWLPSWI